MNNTFLKSSCLVLSVAVAALSGWLTVSFMFSIGQSVNAPITTAAIGGLLDLTKCVSPAFVLLFLARKRYCAFLFALLLSLSLSLVSFAASVASLESGVIASQQHSAVHQRLTQQIALYTDQVNELRNLAVLQQQTKQITKSQKTLNEVNALLAKIDALSQEQANTKGSSTVDRYGMYVAYIAAGALELTSWLLVFVLSALRTHTQTHLTTLMHTDSELSVVHENKPEIHTPSDEHSTTLSTHCYTDAMNDNAFECVDDDVESDKCDEQLCREIKKAILTQTVRPSHRGISAHFGNVGRDIINRVLDELSQSGFLRPYRNGYALAI